MFGSVLFCFWSFSLLCVSSSLVHGNIQLEDIPTAGRRGEPSYLSEGGEFSCPGGEHWQARHLSIMLTAVIRD